MDVYTQQPVYQIIPGCVVTEDGCVVNGGRVYVDSVGIVLSMAPLTFVSYDHGIARFDRTRLSALIVVNVCGLSGYYLVSL